MTGSYKLVITRDAEKELRSLPKDDLRRVDERITALPTHPRPPGVQKLTGLGHYRLRQGNWRIIFEIDDKAKLVTIIKIGHRREVYR